MDPKWARISESMVDSFAHRSSMERDFYTKQWHDVSTSLVPPSALVKLEGCQHFSRKDLRYQLLHPTSAINSAPERRQNPHLFCSSEDLRLSFALLIDGLLQNESTWKKERKKEATNLLCLPCLLEEGEKHRPAEPMLLPQAVLDCTRLVRLQSLRFLRETVGRREKLRSSACASDDMLILFRRFEAINVKLT